MAGTRVPAKALRMLCVQGTFALFCCIISTLSTADRETLLRTFQNKEPALVPQAGRLYPLPIWSYILILQKEQLPGETSFEAHQSISACGHALCCFIPHDFEPVFQKCQPPTSFPHTSAQCRDLSVPACRSDLCSAPLLDVSQPLAPSGDVAEEFSSKFLENIWGEGR